MESDEGSGNEPDGCEAEDAPTEAPSGAVFDVREASSDDDTMHTAEPGYVTFEPDGSSVYTDAPSGFAVDMESDEGSGNEPDGCEAEAAPTEAPLGAAFDVPLAAQPKGESPQLLQGPSPSAMCSGTSSKFTFFFFIRFFPFLFSIFLFVSFPSIFSFTNSFSFSFLISL